ncbi:MAG: ATP-dependent metallopeptidase FtsH/Yme1/Tma family protein [Deltaproteobacteria bacterium]|nr:MAG: ATP-dependent metallopeptidase FtsH/Yme1/Tma family protein [Deltaproteobacteria bacterium]
MKQSHKSILLWALLIVMFVSFFQLLRQPAKNERKLDYASFLAELEQENVESVKIKGEQYTGTLKTGEAFATVGPKLDAAAARELYDKYGVKVEFEPQEQGSIWLSLFLNWLPLIFIFLLFLYFMRQLQSGGGKAMSFGKSKAKLLTEHTNKVTFDDVAGIEEAKEELEEIVAFLKDPKRFTRLGGRIPKGVLMMGSPGTGKTLLARAIAGEAGVPFFSISGSDFVEMFVGVGASRVRDLFEQGKKHAPCIIFIDEIDAVGRHRGAGLGGGHDEREQTLNQLLVEMDGFEANEGVIIVAATNRPDVLDPALLRPGRFDRRIVVPRPDLRGRVGILQVHTRKMPIAPNVDLEVIARGTPGFSGADLENLVNEAALVAARKGKDAVDLEDFEWAKDKVLMGTERRSMIMSEEERRTTAVHEAGHALVAHLLPDTDPLHKVTIIPRGRALGVTMQLPEEDKYSYHKEYLLNRIAVMMGGRLAEEIVFGRITSGAANDIEQATEMARRMVCEWGMSEKLGPLNYAQSDGEVFLGRDIQTPSHYSQQTAEAIDAEVARIVKEQYQRARQLLEENREKLDRLAQALMEYETLSGAEVETVLAGGEIERAPSETAAPPPAEEQKAQAKDKKKILEALEGLAQGGGMPEPENA